jgi:Tol biopolymer transport system component
MIKKALKTLFLLFLFISVSYANSPSAFARYPDLNKDGTRIVFNFQGDLWTVPVKGGSAQRLTIHEAYDFLPMWSSDDRSIAFSSNRYGNYDVFTVPSTGGIPKRITFHSSGDLLSDYAQDNTLLFTTSRTFRHVEWDHELASVSDNGGTPELLLDAVGEMPVKSPDGKFIAFVKGWGRIVREAYRGSANNDIWIYNTQTEKYTKVTDFDGHDNQPKWADSRTLYYLSSESGKYNIHKLTIDDNGSKIGTNVQITDYTDDGIRYFNLSGNGKFAVFERQTDIYTIDLLNGNSDKLNINISADYRFDPVVLKTFSSDIQDYDVSPNGKYTAFVVRGEIFIRGNDKDKSKTRNLSENPYRDQHVAWLNDTSIVFVSDREGQQDLYLLTSGDESESNLFKTLKLKTERITNTPEDESWPVISPDKKKIAYEIGIGKLVVEDIGPKGELSNRKDLLDGWAAPGNVCWSPDSRWLSYSLDDLYFNQEIFIQRADNSIEPVNVSMHPRGDRMPAWSKDGSKLAWISERSNNDSDVWFVWLKKEDWERTKDDWEEYEKPEEKKKDKKDEKEGKDKEVQPIIIDIENIFERTVKVTAIEGDESNVQISDDGETIYFTAKSPTKKGTDLFSIKWDGKDIKELTTDGSSPSSVKLSPDGKHLYFTEKGKLSKLDLDKSKKESLSFSAKMYVNFPVEKEQKFEEGWRALRLSLIHI